MMKKLLEIYNQFDVVVVPFPFTDSAKTKRRPALILSSEKEFNAIGDHYVLAMITSAKNSSWPLDCPIKDLASTSLESECIIRMKVFTLDASLILKKIGVLSPKDKVVVKKNIKLLFGI